MLEKSKVDRLEEKKTDRSSPFVSVIVPVYNDVLRLKICLGALEGQTYPQECYEVIVVENDSDDDIEPIVRKFPHTRFDREVRPGSFATRNKGLAIAKGEIVAFTDSDCIPYPDWIEKGVQALTAAPNIGLVGGKVMVFTRNDKDLSFVEFHQTVCGFPQKRYVEKLKFSTTASLFTFKHVLDEVGCFDPKIKSGGDVEWGERVYKAGYFQVYSEAVLVKHPARFLFFQIGRKRLRTTGGYFKLNPPMVQIRRYWNDEKMDSAVKILKFVVVEFFLHFVKLAERARLKLGGQPRRR